MGEPPPVLVRRVVRTLTVQEQVQFQDIQMKQAELERRMRDLLHSWGLDPKRQALQIDANGNVYDVSAPQAWY